MGLDSRSVNAQKFDRFRVPSLPLVDGDEVEDFVMSDAMYGESQTDGHEGWIDLVWDHVLAASARVDQNIPPLQELVFPVRPQASDSQTVGSRGDLIPEVRSKNTMSLVPMEEVGDTGITSSLRVGRPNVLHLCDLNVREIELRMSSLELGKSL